MKLVMRIFTPAPGPHYGLVLMVLIGLLAVVVNGVAATASPSASLSASLSASRAKLDSLLVCQQAEKEAAFKEKTKVETHLHSVQAFRATLTDEPKYRAAIEKTERALVRDQEALVKADERFALAEKKIGMTLRALKYLEPDASANGSALSDASRRYKNWRADAENESRYVDGLFGSEYGFVSDPALLKNLNAMVSRLQMLSPVSGVPFQVRVLAAESGRGAAATATTIYFDKAYLDRNPSESELMFVAGHELAHIQLGHFSDTILGMEKDKQQLSKKNSKDFGKEGAASLGERSKEVMQKMRTAPWERAQEEAADLLGAEQALDAGASPKGIEEAMQRMEADEKAGAKKTTADVQRYEDSMRDHAKPMDRLKTLEASFGEKFWEHSDLKSSSACPK